MPSSASTHPVEHLDASEIVDQRAVPVVQHHVQVKPVLEPERARRLQIRKGCQVGLFEAKYDKFGLLFKELALKFFNIY